MDARLATFAAGAAVGLGVSLGVALLSPKPGAAAPSAPSSQSPAASSSSPSASKALAGPGIYETDKSVSDYLTMHFASHEQLDQFRVAPPNALDFPAQCAQECISAALVHSTPTKRVLDIGCAVGRSSFELARAFEHVVAIDFSAAFIRAANQLKKEGAHPYVLAQEGLLGVEAVARVPGDIDRSKIEFRQGDACNLPADIGTFDVVLAANLICRLPDPKKFLVDLKRIVKPGGLVIITSPYTWLADYTPVEKWLGGRLDDAGQPISGFKGLQSVLDPDFELVKEKNLPFFIRETARKNQLTTSHVTVWKRRLEQDSSAALS